jgi:DNA polymerase-4
MSNDTNTFQPPQSLNWLFFDLNSYFASVEQQDNPALRGKPVAVIPSDTDATCAIAASYEAKAFGIKTGTKIYEAKKMCPDLQCVLARHHVYVEYHQRIFNEVENHIPITKKCSIDEAACKLLKNEQYTDHAISIAKRIKQGLRDNIGEYIKCSIGIAPNMFLAKTATDMQKPDGLVILEPSNYKQHLFKLRLGDLCGIGYNMEHRLNKAGIHTIEQLWNISPKHARKIWGNVAGEVFWYRLHGYDIPDKPTQKRVVGHSRVLDPEFRASDKAYSMALNLTTKACARLRRYQLYARKLSLSVRAVDRYYWADDKSFSPTQDNFTIKQALDDMWRRMQWETRKANLKKVSVTLHDLYESKDITLDLFEVDRAKTNQDQNNQLSQTMDKINKRFGSNTVNLGTCPKTNVGYVGTKVAFNRIPELEEFSE